MWKPETTFSRFWIVRENWERKLNANDVVDLLNEQHEQIERLKDNFRALDEVKCELADENEQLKKENYELHKRLGDFEPFEEHIKERTSKTSINDIVGLVKTDEPTDIVELKRS